MANTNPLTRRDDVQQRKRYSASMSALKPWLAKFHAVFPTQDVTELQVASYVEALADLTPEEIDAGCREAMKTSTQFPKPGHIREALATFKIANRYPFLGPPALTYPPVPPEERMGAEEFRLKMEPKPKEQPKPEMVTTQSTLSIAEQKAELQRRGFSIEHNGKCLCPKCRDRRNAQ